LKQFVFLLGLLSFLNPAYGSRVKVENKNPEIKWIGDLAREIERNPDPWIKYIDRFRSQFHEIADDLSFDECRKREDFQGNRYCIMSIARVTKSKNPFLDHPAFAANRPNISGYTLASASDLLVNRLNWAYVCVALAPAIGYFVVGLLNPVTAIPSAVVGSIVAGTTALTCLAINRYQGKKKLDKIEESIKSIKDEMSGMRDEMRNEMSGMRDELKEIKKSQDEHEKSQHNQKPIYE